MPAVVTLSLTLGGLAGWWWCGHNIRDATDEPAPRVRTSVLVGLLVTFCLYPIQRNKDINFFFGDEMIVVSVAQRIADGALLYRDVWEFLEPGSFMLLAGIFAVFGSSVMVLDICTLALFGGIAACMHRIVARTVSLRAAWLTVVAFLLVLRPVGVSLLPHWMSTLAALLTLAFLLDETAPTSRVRLLAAGACLAATFLFQQHKGLFLATTLGPAYIVACIAKGAGPRRTVQSIGWLVVGSFALVGPLALWLTFHHLWGDWWYATFTWLREGYGPANREAPVLLPLDWSLPLPTILRSLWGSADLTVLRLAPLFFIAAPLALLRRNGDTSRTMLWLVWAGALGAFGTAVTRYEQMRLMYTAPTTLVLAAVVLGRLHTRRPADAADPRRMRLIAAVAAVCVFCLAAAQQYRVHVEAVEHGQHLVVDSPRGRVLLWSSGWGDLNDMGPIIAALQTLPRDAGLFVYPGGWGYGYLSGLRNGTPYHFALPEYTRPAQWDRLMAAIDDPSRVQYVVWDRTFDAAWMRDIVPTLAPDVLWQNSLVARLQSPAWRPLLETPSVTLYARAAVATEPDLRETR